MKNGFREVITFACLLCLGAGLTQVRAQSAGGLSGRITDSQGAAVPGATVTLYARATNARATTVTDERGGYRFERLPEGDYVIEATAAGFGRFSRTFRVEKGRPGRWISPWKLRESAKRCWSRQPERRRPWTRCRRPSRSSRRRKSIGVMNTRSAKRAVPGLRVQQLGGPGTFARFKPGVARLGHGDSG